MVAVRLVELFFLSAWLVGFWLVWKHTRHTLLLGVYLGCTLSWTHDWVLAGPEIWRMDFHPDTIWIASWGTRNEGLWAPLSYGAFFGIGAFVWLKYLEAPLRQKLGAWRYLVIFPAVFAGNVIVEGAIIEWAHTNRYHQAGNWLLFNIPWLHFVTTGVMLAGIIFFTVEAMKLLDHFGWHELEPAPAALRPERVLVSPSGAAASQPEVSTTAGASGQPVPRRVRTAIFVVGLALPQAAFTAATMVGLYLYDWIGVPS
ncbi:MAG TPA: hypothetical protein VGL92_03315 [Acidimicrobiia bacterium]|jgi:hypothetical protein